MPLKTCTCGSGLPRSAVHDARGIFVTFVCNQCEARKLASFRPEIFTDADYDTFGEQVEPDC